ncbi:MAG: tRNA uracil 4-sulfurtransferase ThiI [Clostridia bacterium]
MENVLLVKYAELHLKGLNRPFFEKKLMENMKTAVSRYGGKVSHDQGRIYVTGVRTETVDFALERLLNVFGIHSISKAIAVDKDFESIVSSAADLLNEAKSGEMNTFKVLARRSDKKYPMDSTELCRELGHALLERVDGVSVDVHDPKIKLTVEIREDALLYTNEYKAAGGMPVGTAGHSMLMLSGGIDSPVAGYMMARRGAVLSAIHFYSYPYTSERAKDKVIELAKILSRYVGTIKLHIIPFTDIQMKIHEVCPEKETTLIMRRFMMRIAESVALEEGAISIITGESLGQVASQTMEALSVTNSTVNMPVFRPLIGFDKEDITRVARKIGTFEISILPYEDCCTVFVPKHPVTKPKLDAIIKSEAEADFSELLKIAIEGRETIIIR